MTTDSGLEVVVDSLRRMDLRPTTGHLGGLRQLAAERLPSRSRRQQLVGWRDRLFHLEDTRLRLLQRPGGQPPVAAATGVAVPMPSLDTGPLVLGRDGRLRLWQGRELGPEIWRSDEDWRTLGLVRVPGGGLHVRHFEAGRSELLDPLGNRLWERQQLSTGLLVVPGAIIELDLADDDRVRATELDTGQPLWEFRAPARVERLIAAVGTRLWLVVCEDTLVALDLATGRPGPTQRIDALSRVVSRVTDSGRLYLCTGNEVAVIDLAGDGREVSRDRFADEHRPGGSEFTRIDSAGRLVFADEGQRVWVAEPDDLSRPQLLVTMPGLITGMELHDGCLFVLSARGDLTVFGGDYPDPNGPRTR